MPRLPTFLMISLPLACSSSGSEPVEARAADVQTAEVALPPPSVAPPATGTLRAVETTRVVTVAPPEGPDAEFGPTCQQYFKALQLCNAKAMASVTDPVARETMRKSFDDALATTHDAWRNIERPSLQVACEVALDALSNNPACK